MKNSLNLIIFITFTLLIFISFYIYECKNGMGKYFKSSLEHGVVAKINKHDRFNNRKFTKTDEEIELTKLSPNIDALGCIDEMPIALFIPSVAQIEGQSYERRNILRNTWLYEARVVHSLSVYFLIGLSKNQTVNEILKEEATEYGDIIQFQFSDNLTLKSISMLRWAQRKCSNTLFIMKVDDNVILNIDRLLESIKSFNRGITGHRVNPIRNLREAAPRYKPPENFLATEERYPSYVYGGAYVIATDVINRLIIGTDNYAGFYPDKEDLFLTGIIAGIVGIESYDSEEFFLSFNCELEHLSKMSSLIALVDCQSNQQFLDFWIYWKLSSFNQDTPCKHYTIIIIVLSILNFLFIIVEIIKVTLMKYRDNMVNVNQKYSIL